MFQTLSIPSTNLPSVNRRFPAPLSIIHNTRRLRLSSVRCRSATAEGFAARVVFSRNPAPAILYEVLTVRQNASPADIKKTYRRLAKVFHPDVAAAAISTAAEVVNGRDFIQIHNAYEALSDPKARAVYDRSIGMGGRRKGARWAVSTTSFGGYSSSPRSSPRSSTTLGRGF